MGIGRTGMGGSGNVKSHSRASLDQTEFDVNAAFVGLELKCAMYS